MSRQHTPGPWKWSPHKNSPHLFDLVGGNGNVIVRVVIVPEMDGSDIDDDLIEAAPDLLEALRNLSATVDAAILSGDWKVDGACDPDMDIAAARAAIAKARGDA